METSTTPTRPADGDSELGSPPLINVIQAELERCGGRMTFARFMELALYHPRYGYYLGPDRRPGRAGDFLTAPETHPFFGFTVARQIAECWRRLGEPGRFEIREYGAGVGGLAYDIVAALSTEAPVVAAALRYRLVEPNPHLQARAMAAMADVGLSETVVVEDATAGSELEPIDGVVLANEVADALPVHRLVWREGQLRERFVEWSGAGFTDVDASLSPEASRCDPETMLRTAGVTLADGDAIEISPLAADWFATAARGLRRGYAIVIDYGYAASHLYRDHRLEGTLRAYRQHQVTDDPFHHIGQQDLTAHVDFSALRRAGEASGLTLAGLTTQGAFLTSLGLGDYLVQMQQEPATTADEYLATKAAVFRLIDPGGMGRFGVLIMARDAPGEPALAGFAVAAPAF